MVACYCRDTEASSVITVYSFMWKHLYLCVLTRKIFMFILQCFLIVKKESCGLSVTFAESNSNSMRQLERSNWVIKFDLFPPHVEKHIVSLGKK